MKKQADLRRWLKEKWVDISRKDKNGKHPPCGRSSAGKGGGYPKCRPSKKVTKETPSTSKGMSKKTKEKAVKQKRNAEKKPRKDKKPHMTSHHKLKKKSSNELIMNKHDWTQIGIKAGWIKIAQSEEERRMIDKMVNSEPLLPSNGHSNERVLKAIKEIDESCRVLMKIKDELFDATDYIGSEEKNELENKFVELSSTINQSQYGQPYGMKAILDKKDQARVALDFLDSLLYALGRHGLAKTDLAKKIRSKILANSKLLESLI